jgi:hypothetical protein
MNQPTKKQGQDIRNRHPRKQFPIIGCKVCGKMVCTTQSPYCSSECKRKGQDK